jgi:hypothetical protein
LDSLALTYDAVLDRLDDSLKEPERSDELPSPLEVPPLPPGPERSLLAKALVEPAEPDPEEPASDDPASDASESEPSLLSAPDDPALLLSSLE